LFLPNVPSSPAANIAANALTVGSAVDADAANSVAVPATDLAVAIVVAHVVAAEISVATAVLATVRAKAD
jgi:hypothetical protein